jgi:hypothetical protein
MIWHSKQHVFKQIEENLVFWKTKCSGLPNRTIRFQPVHSARIYSVEPNSAEPDSPFSGTGGSGISKTLGETSKTMTAGPDDWRTPLIHYLENPGHIADRKVQQQALKYVMLDNTLYR